MTDGVDGERSSEPAHVFDQTNGVLDAEDDRDERSRGVTKPPSSFGVPPIVSL